MQPPETPIQDHQATAEKIRTGEYFREAREMYDFSIHDPMAERYFYVFVSVLSLLIFLIAFFALQGLYPLKTSVAFIYDNDNIIEDIPRIHSLLRSKDENANEALLRFMVQNYVGLREEYDIDKFDHDVSGVKSQSTPDVYSEFQQVIDPRSPDSPISLYQRHTKRKITIVSSQRLYDQEYGMEVIYEANLESKEDSKKSRWQANIAFNYSGIELDEKGNVKPITFTVTQYHTKRLQDVK